MDNFQHIMFSYVLPVVTKPKPISVLCSHFGTEGGEMLPVKSTKIHCPLKACYYPKVASTIYHSLRDCSALHVKVPCTAGVCVNPPTYQPSI